MEQLNCPTCGHGGVIDIIRGLTDKPVKTHKCTQCGREFKRKEKENEKSSK